LVDLDLADPGPQRLGADTQLPRHPGDHPKPLARLLDGLVHHAHRPLPQLGWIAPLEGVRAAAVAAGLCHCSIFPSQRWSLQQTQSGSLLLDELGEAGRIDLEKVHGDKAYDHRRCRAYLRQRGIRPRIARRMIESSTRLGRHRWTIERTGAWLGGCASDMSETPDASMLWRCWPVR
jgi:hypothetical protein